jgi:hypothetical protein
VLAHRSITSQPQSTVTIIANDLVTAANVSDLRTNIIDKKCRQMSIRMPVEAGLARSMEQGGR